jgi:anti-sigma regulatory factor (Ser/Thr protein kinase)
VKRVRSAQTPAATTWEAVLERGVTAPARARHELAGQLDGELSTARKHDLLLLASELVANSVVHADPDGAPEIRVALVLGPGAVRVMVTEAGSLKTVSVQPRDPLRIGGRGLLLVECLSDSWGTERDASGQTRVWFEMLRHPLASSSEQRP